MDELWAKDGVQYKTVVVQTGADLGRELDACVNFLAEGVQAGDQVLVCCPDGNSRSAAVAMAYWMCGHPSEGVAQAKAWYRGQRRGLELGEGLYEMLEEHQNALGASSGAKRSTLPGACPDTPETPGKKAATAAAAEIEEIKL
eukprot:TRINITY_DN2071_c0_g1_i3.p1 TRINITY_DN2071_c0_g1~~TRINITY_DN2071_c0_g1_i3.p1  ORF type:complete len:143 (+),score=37.99 TRINITY_DN2071_c0_g1_i3:531-959(+)